MRFVRGLYADVPAVNFGPLALKAVREKMIAHGWTRGTINKQVDRVRRKFRWGVENELVPPATHQALTAVTDLRRGKSEARETEPILPVLDAVVQETLPRLPAIVADMVRFQRLTGCRPVEVCLIRL